MSKQKKNQILQSLEALGVKVTMTKSKKELKQALALVK